MRLARVGLFVQSLLYIASGINHFWHRELYVRIVPHHYLHPDALVRWSGLAEIFGGIGLLIPVTRRLSSVGIALMLIAFLDVHVFMLRHPELFPQTPIWMLWVRLPLQGILIWWALYYARNRLDAPMSIHILFSLWI